MNEKFILCECECELLKMSIDIEDNYTDVNLAIYTYGQYNSKPNLWQRLKYCWRHLRTGKIYNDQIVLSSDKAKQIADWIYENLK